MILTPTVSLASSTPNNYTDIVSTAPTDHNTIIKFNIMLNRPESVTEYADSIIAGQNPILSYEEFSSRFSSSENHINLIKDFASTVGFIIEEIHTPSATIKLSGTALQINSAFGVILTDYTNTTTTFISHSGPVNIPSTLHGVVEYVLGLDQSVRIKRNKGTITNASIPQTTGAVATWQLAAVYNYPGNDANGVTVGIMEWGGGYTQNNLTSTFTQNIPVNGATMPRVPIIGVDTVDVFTDGGVNDPTESGGAPEVMLDIYCVWGSAPLCKMVLYFGYGAGASSPTAGPNWYNNFNTAIHDTVNNPSVLSTSWGAGENYATDGYWSAGTVSATEAVLAQSVVLGITIVVSSGDNGSTWAGYVPEVEYPASSRYVTAVGGTSIQLTAQNSVTRSSEVVWNGSGGGQSIYQSLPSWQAGLYYTTATTGGSFGSPISLAVRGVPDVAGNSDPYTGYTFYEGSSNSYVQYGGTSAATPMVAGLIARLNALTGKRIGFANPFLYANPSAFYDIVSGYNAVYVQGYNSTVGWDAVTGLGVPVGTSLYKVLKTGSSFPKENYGFRPKSGAAYPRRTTGAR